MPVVLDADGLNAFAGDAGDLADRKAEAVLTPHLGEFARLTGWARGAPTTGSRLRAPSPPATRAVALVKGTRTVVADPVGAVRDQPDRLAGARHGGHG